MLYIIVYKTPNNVYKERKCKMESKLLSNKKVLRNKDGDEYMDLYSSMLQFTPEGMSIINSFYVGDDMAMRPDLISVTAYGTDMYWDVLLKFNAISNPFSIAPNQLIHVPELNWLLGQLKDYDVLDVVERVRSQYIDTTKGGASNEKKKGTEVQDKYKLYNQLKNNFSGLPPNISNPGESEIVIGDGKVILR